MKTIDASAFQAEVLEAKTPVLVDFWAEWCKPCKAIASSLEEISRERPDVAIVKIEADKNRDLAAELNVRSIPTLILFKDGKSVAIHTGAAPKAALRTWLDSSIARSA